MNNPGATVMSAKRQRIRFDFWLDLSKPEEKQLAEWLQSLKKKRKFLPTLRAASLLYRDLNTGNTAVLDQLFPHVRHIPPQQPTLGPKPLQLRSGPLPAPPGESLEHLLEVKQASAPAGYKSANLTDQLLALTKREAV